MRFHPGTCGSHPPLLQAFGPKENATRSCGSAVTLTAHQEIASSNLGWGMSPDPRPSEVLGWGAFGVPVSGKGPIPLRLGIARVLYLFRCILARVSPAPAQLGSWRSVAFHPSQHPIRLA